MSLSTSLFLKYTRLCRRKYGSPFFIQSVRVTSDTPSSAASSCLDNRRSCSSCLELPPVLKCSCSSARNASRMHWLRACSLIISIAFVLGQKNAMEIACLYHKDFYGNLGMFKLSWHPIAKHLISN